MTQRSDTKWKTLRVVVELPIQGPMSDGDLRWKIENTLVGSGLTRYFIQNGCRVGQMAIKRFDRVLTALDREDKRKTD